MMGPGVWHTLTSRALGQAFTKIWGVGTARARDLYSDGFTTIEQLRKDPQVAEDLATMRKARGTSVRCAGHSGPRITRLRGRGNP